MMMPTRRCCFTAVALVLACCLGESTSEAKQASSLSGRHSPFVAAVARNWAAWDVDHDGVLSPAEIERAVLDPSVKDDDAAAAAALEMVARNTKKYTLPPLTREYFEQYDAHATGVKISGADAAAATVDTERASAGAPKWDLLFAASRHRIHPTSAAVTGSSSGGPSGSEILQHMRQGPLGDCFFVAVVGSAVNRDPSLVGSVLSPTGGGRYRVAFASPGGAFVLPPLTDAERALSSSSSGEGEWLAALEQAYGRFHHMLHPRAADAPVPAAAVANAPLEGTDTICHGGTPGPVITALIGHASKYVPLPHDAAKRAAEAERMQKLLRADLADAFHDRMLVVAMVNAAPTKPADDTPPKTTDAGGRSPDGENPTETVASASLPSPPNISHGHCYAVVGYDADTDVVTLWNPHGQTFRPKGPAGLTNGYDTSHGIFRVPLAQLYQFYSAFSFETPRAAGATASRVRPG